MGSLLGGGGSSSSATNTTNVEVEVNPQITNTVVVDDSRLQAMVDKIAAGNEQSAILAAAQIQASREATAAAAGNVDKLSETFKSAVVTAVVGFAVTQLLKRG